MCPPAVILRCPELAAVDPGSRPHCGAASSGSHMLDAVCVRLGPEEFSWPRDKKGAASGFYVCGNQVSRRVVDAARRGTELDWKRA